MWPNPQFPADRSSQNVTEKQKKKRKKCERSTWYATDFVDLKKQPMTLILNKLVFVQLTRP